MMETLELILKWYTIFVAFVGMHFLAYFLIREGIRDGLFK
jgi:hypothetical protein